MRLKGKQLSLFSKLLAVLIVVGALFLKIITENPIPMDDVIKASLFVALVFSPVDVSLWVETFFQAFGGRRDKILPCDDDEVKP